MSQATFKQSALHKAAVPEASSPPTPEIGRSVKALVPEDFESSSDSIQNFLPALSETSSSSARSRAVSESVITPRGSHLPFQSTVFEEPPVGELKLFRYVKTNNPLDLSQCKLHAHALILGRYNLA